VSVLSGAEFVDEVVPELEKLGLDLVEAAGVVRDYTDCIDYGRFPFGVKLNRPRGANSFEPFYSPAGRLEVAQLVEDRVACRPRDFDDAVAGGDLYAVEALGHRGESKAGTRS
jgi:hypothetical protein